MVLVIDSSVFVAGFHERDAHHVEAAACLRRIAGDRRVDIVVPVLVPLETMHVLGRHGAALDVVTTLSSFSKIGAHVALDIITLRGWIERMRVFPLRTHDAFIAAVAWEYRATLVSLDRKFLRAYRAAGGTALLPRDCLASE